MVFLLLLVFAGFMIVRSAPCNPTVCTLPNCRCYNDPSPPGKLETSDVPQIIMVSMFGTLNDENFAYYESIFRTLVNPNGCPIRGTFFVQDQGTDYGLLRTMYDLGHEIGIHSLNGMAPQTTTEWIQMYKAVLRKLSDFGIDEKTVYGTRAPELSEGGTGEFIGLSDLGLLYDSSCTSVALSTRSTMIWPYTLDYDGPVCDSGRAPDLTFQGKWEVPIADLHDLTPSALPCSVPSACRNITTKKDAYDLFFKAFIDHYDGKRTPFNMIVDPAWVKNDDFRDGTIEFLEYIRAAFNREVWIVPIHKTLQWIQDPTPIANLTDFKPWKC